MIIFGGLVIFLISIYFLLALYKHFVEQRQQAENEAKIEGLTEDYEQFKKMKMMELEAIERNTFQTKSKSSASKFLYLPKPFTLLILGKTKSMRSVKTLERSHEQDNKIVTIHEPVGNDYRSGEEFD